MNDPNISRGNVCKYLCIGRQWLRLGSDEGINRFLSHYRVELFSGVANAAISYNVVNISLSLASMELNSVQSRVMEGEILSTMIGGMIGESLSCLRMLLCLCGVIFPLWDVMCGGVIRTHGECFMSV